MTQDLRGRFLQLLQEAIATRTLKRVVLSRPSRPMHPPGFADEGPVLQRVRIQPVRVRDGVKLAFGWQYDTRDQTDNLPVDDALSRIEAMLGDMRTALLETGALTAELGFSKRGRPLFRMKKVSQGSALSASDDPSGPEVTASADGGAHAGGMGAGAAWQPGVGALTQLRRVGHGGAAGQAGPAPAGDDGWGELAAHNRQRQYPVAMDRPFLVDLGIVARNGAVVPAMARKWRQINRFVEIVALAWQHNTLAARVGGAGQRPLRIRDYGSGKGYLTFALHDYLTHVLGLQVETVGIERRGDLVALCNRLARHHGLAGLRFEKGDILQAGARQEGDHGQTVRHADDDVGVDETVRADRADIDANAEASANASANASASAEAPEAVAGFESNAGPGVPDGAAADIVIALHACDTATDDALFQGIRQQAAMLVCSPCCHRELRPQLKAPAPLDALLRHGIHLGQEAEMLTDGLRALLLEAEGYEAQVFEFISPEHTGKNKMILGNRTGKVRDAVAVRAEIEALKRFYGIRVQHLDALLGSRRA